LIYIFQDEEVESFVNETSKSNWYQNITPPESPVEANTDTIRSGYQFLCDELLRLKSVDKKRYQHRIIYRYAWILYYKYENPEAARNEMSLLFNSRPTSKSLVCFFRPEFERPGKYFVCVQKYLIFFIDLLEACNDMIGLRNVARKIKKAEDFILDIDQIWTHAIRFVFV
jgi:hypothetical protein